MPKDLKKLTLLEKNKQIKKEFNELAEMLENPDQLGKEVEKKAKEEEAQDLEKLAKLRRLPKIFSYKERLCIYMANLLHEGGVPSGWAFEAEIEDKGVGIKVKRQEGRGERVVGYRRFAISGDPIVDYRYALSFADWAHALMHKREEKKTPNGIILPQ